MKHRPNESVTPALTTNEGLLASHQGAGCISHSHILHLHHEIQGWGAVSVCVQHGQPVAVFPPRGRTHKPQAHRCRSVVSCEACLAALCTSLLLLLLLPL
jgi:hypothetical protein